MKENKKPLLIFDCFGVIIEDDISNIWMDKHLDKDTIKKLRLEVFPKSDIGLIDCNELFKQLSIHSNIEIEQIRKDFIDLIKYNYEVIDLIKHLKSTYHIALLSNAPNEICSYISKDKEIFELFDECVFSCECHMIKPNIDIYQYLLNKFKNSYNYAVMIDDNPTNLSGAKKAGIKYTIEFKSTSDTKLKLQNIEKASTN